jgi:tRNA 5-methylaminomethyl-2-thiouridine biosynthesis bifunctional protein
VFDVAVIGGGATGSCAAYFCKQAGLSVCLYEEQALASKASGAAGAFISPRIGRGGKLQELTNEAYAFAVSFYRRNFPSHFHQTGTYRIARDEKDAGAFKEYEKHNTLEYENARIGGWPAFFFPDAGAADAAGLCQALCKDIEIRYEHVDDLSLIPAKHIILATGAQQSLVDITYMGLRKTWGQRCDIKTPYTFERSMHKDVSVSATVGGLVRVGATHDKDPLHPCGKCNENFKNLMRKAQALRGLGDYSIEKVYCGMRSAVRDYFPVAGRVVDTEATLAKYPTLKKGPKPGDGLIYHDNVYIIGGTGGRGFVFSPILAHALSGYIAKAKPIDERIGPDRLFYKWVRKLD